MLSLLVIVLLSYLVGSIPTALLAARWLRGIDIRQHGSGNAGATNVFRVLGPGPGVTVMLLDALKGVIAVGLFSQIRIAGEATPALFGSYGHGWMMVAAGAAAVIGHIYTVYAGFKGGKGVATGAGVAMALAPIPVLVGVALFGLIVMGTRYVSLGSMVAAASLPLTQLVRTWVFGVSVPAPMMWFCAVIPFLILFTHRANIRRLLTGTESRIGPKPAA
jgi:acyl phosphate:glycerol-3-phosphate acyltransferase